MTRSALRHRLTLVVVLSATALSQAPARSGPMLPATPYRYANVELPAHFALPRGDHDNTPRDNPITDDGATLGRVLFYDTRLSADNSTSCASCHIQAHAFADPRRLSRGVHGAVTDRHAMQLVNVRYYQRGRLFWDERAGSLEEMVLLPVRSRIEMGQDIERVVAAFERDATYAALFARAFGDRQITEQRLGKALAQFVRALVSSGSRYDEGRARVASAQDDFDTFTVQENRGKALFMRNCAGCHMKDGDEHFFVPTPANTGLRASSAGADGGVGDVTLRVVDFGSFKSPSLRNVEVTAPFGHDGRFATLEAVIDHYSNNAIRDPDRGYADAVRPLRFTASERAALVAFLNTLTDRTFLTDPRFSNPFVERPRPLERGRRAVRTGLARLTSAGTGAAEVLALYWPSMPAIGMPPPPPRPWEGLPHPVVQRLLFFDRNRDLRISPAELPERMQGLVARGDSDADGALDVEEIGVLVIAAGAQPDRAAVRPRPSDGLPGVIGDLKLPPAKHAGALAIAARHPLSGAIGIPPRGVLHGEMRALLDDEEFGNFVAAAARLSPRGVHFVR